VEDRHQKHNRRPLPRSRDIVDLYRTRLVQHTLAALAPNVTILEGRRRFVPEDMPTDLGNERLGLDVRAADCHHSGIQTKTPALGRGVQDAAAGAPTIVSYIFRDMSDNEDVRRHS